MKRIYTIMSLIFAILFIITGCTAENFDSQSVIKEETDSQKEPLNYTQNIETEKEADNELIGVWCNYYELSMKESGGGTEEQFREKVNEMFSVSKKSVSIPCLYRLDHSVTLSINPNCSHGANILREFKVRTRVTILLK